MRKIDRVLQDVDLFLERRRDIDRRVGHDQRIGMRGHVHDEAMADAPAGAQSGIVTHHFGHETVGVQAALHQRGRPPVADEPHRRGCRRLAVRRIDDLIVADRQPARRGGRFDQAAGRPGSVRSALRAASSAPSSELRSHGCATAVGIGASVRQCSMRRRYFSCLFSIVVPGCPSLHTLEGRYRLLGRPLRGRRAQHRADALQGRPLLLAHRRALHARVGQQLVQ